MPIGCRVTRDVIDPAESIRDCSTDSDGAVLLFLGTVRDRNEGRPVGHLDYHAYEAMAERVLDEICREAEVRWPIGRASVVHRIGRLELGAVSVSIVVASPHRNAAYDASRYIIEELKKRAPIWKREGYLDGDSEWLTGLSVGSKREGA